MNKVKSQLKRFYKRKGLTGKRLKRAVWADVERVKVNSDYPHTLNRADGISELFVFSASPEGSRYWGARAFPQYRW